MPNPENLKPAKKGEVRNPKGINQYSAMNELRELLESDEIEVKINGKVIKVSTENGNVRKGLFAVLVAKASEGDLRAIQEILNRTEGKPIETVRTHEINEEPIRIINRD